MITLSRTYKNKAECLLCPHYCKIDEGNYGICGVRKNEGGVIKLKTYGILSALALDPIEKKPLYHFFPGNNILSAGSYGCNMRCDFCQNHSISQTGCENINNTRQVTPVQVVEKAEGELKNIGIAFTYNEPVIWFEFVRDTSLLAREKGLKTVLVSNGYVNPEPLEELTDFTDAFNIDLKAFNENFYRKYTGAGLAPVLDTLRSIRKSGKHLEITTLIIPGLNDDPAEMKNQVAWIAEELGREVPFHLSRYYPMYRRENPTTPDNTLLRFYELASGRLDYVYIGNARLTTGQDTRCPGCGTIVTTRTGYTVRLQNLEKDGNCSNCGRKIYSYFNASF